MEDLTHRFQRPNIIDVKVSGANIFDGSIQLFEFEVVCLRTLQTYRFYNY